MKNVRDTTHALLRHWGLTTIFGNPGSNELPFLHDFPSDFRYVLGLHESVVLAMADGYAQASGKAAMVNLHSAAGLGNAMGNLANAAAAGTPLVVTAGQQSRAMVGLGPMLGEANMTRVPEPHVKWSFEPIRAEDVPRALSQAFHLANLPPTGPVFVSLPLDDWDREVDPHEVARLPERIVRWAGAGAPALIAELVYRLQSSARPALVVGPDADTEVAYPLVIELAERLGSPVWGAPGAGRCAFPTRHPLFRGVLRSSIAGVANDLAEFDEVLALGTSVFPYHHYEPGLPLHASTSLIAVSSNPIWASRAAFGDAIVGDVGSILQQLLDVLPTGHASLPPHVAEDDRIESLATAPFAADGLLSLIARSLPGNVRIVKEATSVMAEFWAHVDTRLPRSIFLPAAGGLGFGLPAAVGVALADASRPVVAILGDGSTQYGVTGLWSAVQLNLPITFLVVRNGEYGALRQFVERWGVRNAPGLDLPSMDAVQIAQGYGMSAKRITDSDQLRMELREVGSLSEPRLLEVAVAPT